LSITTIALTLLEQQSHLVFAKKKDGSEIATTRSISNTSDSVNRFGRGSSSSNSETQTPPPTCPDGSERVKGKCVCPDGSSPVNDKCPKPTPTPRSPGSSTFLNVVNQVINNNIGTKKPSDFTITVSGNNPSPKSFPGSSSGTPVTLRSGSYKVTEDNGITGYSTSYSSGCSGDASGGVPIKCSITNVYQTNPTMAKLIVIKKVINNGIGNKNPSDFTMTVSGSHPSPSSFRGNGQRGGSTTVLLRPGSYKVTETGPSGYTSSFSSGCSGRIDADQIRVCDVSNEAKKLPPNTITTIKGLSGPLGLAYDSTNKDIYVTNYGSSSNNDLAGKVSVIDSSTNRVVDTISIGKKPQAIAYDAGNNNIYVANTFSNTVSVINKLANNAIATIPVDNLPGNSSSGIAYHSSNGKIYVTNLGSGTVSVIDGSTNKVDSNIKGFFNPAGVAYDPDNGKIYVTNKEANTVSVINTLRNNNVVATIPVGAAPSAIAHDPDNGKIYVANSGLAYSRGTVSVIDSSTDKVIATIPVGVGPNGVAYDPDNGKIYVANTFSNNISVIDGSNNNVVASIPVDTHPYGVVYNPDNHEIYVANYDSNTVSAIHQ
jgi:YVTN family beta-propeller protein